MSHRIKLKHKYGLDNLIKIVKLSKYVFWFKEILKDLFWVRLFPSPFYS